MKVVPEPTTKQPLAAETSQNRSSLHQSCVSLFRNKNVYYVLLDLGWGPLGVLVVLCYIVTCLIWTVLSVAAADKIVWAGAESFFSLGSEEMEQDLALTMYNYIGEPAVYVRIGWIVQTLPDVPIPRCLSPHRQPPPFVHALQLLLDAHMGRLLLWHSGGKLAAWDLTKKSHEEIQELIDACKEFIDAVKDSAELHRGLLPTVHGR